MEPDMDRQNPGAARAASGYVHKIAAYFADGLPQSAELRQNYLSEQNESLTRINRVGVVLSTLLVAYLAFFSDPVAFPEYASQMFFGRMYVIVIGLITGPMSFVPAFRRHGVIISFFVFLAPALMLAHLTAVMDNHQSDVVAWTFVNIIFCGVYPIPLGYSLAVVLLSVPYYVVLYGISGFPLDLEFRMVLVNVLCASFVTLFFKFGMERVRRREFIFRIGLERANTEIAELNDKLKDENLRLSHELEVAHHIQSIVLPQEGDYRAFRDLEIACQMLPAAEVGGDYYDTIHFGPDGIIAIGDVTDHGLHSGLIMMMVHTALRALSMVERNDIQRVFRVINKLLYDFRLKTQDHRIMSLMILKYLGGGEFVMTGQHESLLILRKDGTVEDIESLEYGMYAGLDANVSSYLRLFPFRLDIGDALILYTDGVTEAVDEHETPFGRQGIIDAALTMRAAAADAIRGAIVDACQKHLGSGRRLDDISVMVIRRQEDKGWDGTLQGTVHVGDKIDFEQEAESAFTLRFLPLDMFDSWQRGSVLSNFTAQYFGHNFPRPDESGLISTVVNELVENAVKFSANNSLPVDLTMRKAPGRLLVRATNSVPHHRCGGFMEVCRQLFDRDLDDLYVERVAEDSINQDASGLGLLLVKKDYCSRLSFDFRFDEDDTVQVSVTAELDFK
jgi:serine phosphatase RsbU (regulator of sigma subunit)